MDEHDHAGHHGDHGHPHDHADDHGHALHASPPRGHNPGHSHDHAHGHSHGSTNERRLSWALAITGIFLVVEVVGALLSHSLALLADAGHMLTDAASLVLALVALRASRRPADDDYSYGRHRFEVLAAFVNGLALLAISLWILVESMLRLMTPQPVAGKVMLIVAVLGVGANLGAFLVLRDGENNINLRGAVLHVLSDLLGSAAAMIAAIVILLSGWSPIDPLLSALVSVLILRSGWRVTRQSARILLEGTPAGLDAGEVASDLLAQVNGLAGVHHVHAWSLTDERPMLTLHAVVKTGADRDAVLSAVHLRLRQNFGIVHATVQLETVDCDAAPEAAPCKQIG
ncbi:MAG: cation transporter [Nevskia sp.]|nr:cation transporter [Nevskia sp.]